MDVLSQHEAFLRAIFDAPDDDTPRLVYADFLQENGEEVRAELIRVQCELARAEDAERIRVLTEQECEIAKRYPSPVVLHNRGFKSPQTGLSLSVGDLLNSEELRGRLAYSTPEYFAVERLYLRVDRSVAMTASTQVAVLLELVAFAKVTALEFEGRRLFSVITARGVAALAQHSGLQRIEHMNLTDNNLDDGAATALVNSPYVGSLKRLRLRAGTAFPMKSGSRSSSGSVMAWWYDRPAPPSGRGS